MANVKGVFIVLYGGCFFAATLGAIESCYYCYKRSRAKQVTKISSAFYRRYLTGIIFPTQISFRKELFDELKFILKYDEYVKVIRQPKSESVEPQKSVTSAASLHSTKSLHTLITGSGTERGD